MEHNNFMKRIFIVFISLLFFFPALAQEKLGVANSNYSSTNSIFLNPSSSVDSRTLMQLNIIGLNFYMMNNVAYLPHFRVWSETGNEFRDPQLSTISLKKFLDIKVELNAPSFVVSNREYGAGFFARVRAEGGVNNIPKEFVEMGLNPNFDSLSRHVDINVRNVKASEMTWLEYGINFGKMYFKHNKTIITYGINAKYLTGINIAYGNIYKLNAKINESQFDIYNFKAKIRYNEPGWNTGKGVGIDLGVTYKKTLNFVENYYSNSQKSNCKFIDYQYKVGVSLLDVGAIRFTKNTFVGDISGSATLMDFKHGNVDSVFRADFDVSQEMNKPILACLPTAISIQADYNLGHHIYVNGTIIQGLTVARIVGVQRTNLISIAPRYETRNLEIAIPLTFHRYIYPQLGFAIRFRTFVLGLDNVLPIIRKQNTYGVNVYFNFGISLFKNPKCKVSHPRYNAPKIPFEGYTFLSLKGKGKSKDKRTVSANGQGVAPSNIAIAKGGKSGSKQGKKKRFRFRRSKKL